MGINHQTGNRIAVRNLFQAPGTSHVVEQNADAVNYSRAERRTRTGRITVGRR